MGVTKLILVVGEVYYKYNEATTRKYVVTEEDDKCYYLCIFRGSSSKIVSISKSVTLRKFTNQFSATREGALALKIKAMEARLQTLKARMRKYNS